MCDYLANKPAHVRANNQLYSMATKFGLESVIEKPKVTLTTYHGAKGREAKKVILMTDCSPSAMEYAVKNPDYERRLAYVGVTRAKDELHICQNQTNSFMRTLAEARVQ
jgi:superfamily I DNA/RNA helicase